MTFTDSVQTCFSKYADFNGCASRSEFWWWALFSWVVSFVLTWTSPILCMVFALGTLIPYIAVGTRRLHDTDRSGWWQLIAIVPFIGWIVLLVFFAQEGTPNSRYAATAEAAPV
jgi:uncharacterized membrane protein YhaH (DUF805 family)